VAVKYIRKSGSDSNGGTSPSDAWLTIGKAIGASGMASGDTVYVGAGVYRETPAFSLSPAAETKIIGDTTGEFTGDPGEVVLTGYTTDDVTAPSGTTLLGPGGRNFYTWERFTFVSGATILATLGTSRDWTFTDCIFIGRIVTSSAIMSHTTTAGTASNLLFDRCRFVVFLTTTGGVLGVTATLHTADYDVNIVFRSCYFSYRNNSAITVTGTAGSGTGKAYGVKIEGCTADGAASFLVVNTTAHAASGSTAKWSILSTGSTGSLSAGAAGQITSDWNRFLGSAPYTNVTAGANDLATNAKSFRPNIGQSHLWGNPYRPYLTPGDDDPHLSFVNDTGMPTTDITGRMRQAGSESANHPVGALGRHDTARKGTTITPDSGSNLELVGPADHDFDVPVDATATTFSIKVRTSGYGGTDYPQALLINGGQIGVSDQTVTATSASGSGYETLTFSSFTPTASGIVTVRLVNRTTNGSGIAAFDTFTVT
jgi:hypothetical protein